MARPDLSLVFPKGIRVMIMWGDGNWVSRNQAFPIPGEVTYHFADGQRMGIKRDDGIEGAAPDDSYIVIPYDKAGNCCVMLENVWLSKFPAALRCGPGGGPHEHVHTADATGETTAPVDPEPKHHIPGHDREEIDPDAWKSFKDLL